MKVFLKRISAPIQGEIKLESSKSESNRALIINSLAGGKEETIKNLSNARDTQTMLALLSEKKDVYDVKDAGTTMRFMTAYLALNGSNSVITGTDRMKQRPIGPLVDALKKIGADITYLEQDGYPPLKINRIVNQLSNEISLPGNISSQYISALLMIAPCLSNGLTITLTTEIYSRPYIQMTLDLMTSFGVKYQWSDQVIKVDPQQYSPAAFTVEGDWSGASYWYSLVALSENDSLTLATVRDQSTQGDREIANIMDGFSVQSNFDTGGVRISKKALASNQLNLDFKSCPDLAQTVMVVAAASGVHLEMIGLESLKIKETDRVAAMQAELKKIGADLVQDGSKWILYPSKNLPSEVEIETYEDHRMAMAFAPLCQIMDVTINDPAVVAKSYPSFWDQMEKLGIEIKTSS